MAVGDAYVFPGFLTPVLTLLFFQSHRLLFSHASAEVRGENTPERKVASTWDRTHNHQVMSPTRSPLSHPGGLWSLNTGGLLHRFNCISNMLFSLILPTFLHYSVGMVCKRWRLLAQNSSLVSVILVDSDLLFLRIILKLGLQVVQHIAVFDRHLNDKF